MITDINSQHYFVLKDGRVVRNLDELCVALKSIKKELFDFHVNDQKNDFSNWIWYVFKSKHLAQSIYDLRYQDRPAIIKKIHTHMKSCIILVVNAGSSSIKFALLELSQKDVLMKGIVDAIGLGRCELCTTIADKSTKKPVACNNHEEGMRVIMQTLLESNVIDDLSDIRAVGHRVVHGGELYTKPTLVDETVVKNLIDLAKLAPLHNPANSAGIEACMKILKVPHVAVFDTAFHHTIAPTKYLYGLPYEYYESYKIRKYGFHGSSHKYITHLMMEYYRIQKKKNPKFIICHLGNGCSVTAVKNGKSFNTTMGFTPLDGLIMGTRCGSLDPAISIHLGTLLHISYEEMSKILNKKSGLLGICGHADMRDIHANQKDEKCRQAMDMFVDRLVHAIGAYIAELEGVNGIIFTAGIGENAWYIRKKVLDHFAYVGLKLDDNKNKANDFIITAKGSHIECFVMPTNEELQIAMETKELLEI